eukprot:14780770-Alexandrium_andersonii.AAC.1
MAVYVGSWFLGCNQAMGIHVFRMSSTGMDCRRLCHSGSQTGGACLSGVGSLGGVACTASVGGLC